MMTDDWCGDDRVPASSLLTFFPRGRPEAGWATWQFIVYTYPSADMYTKVSEAAAPGQSRSYTTYYLPREKTLGSFTLAFTSRICPCWLFDCQVTGMPPSDKHR